MNLADVREPYVWDTASDQLVPTSEVRETPEDYAATTLRRVRLSVDWLRVPDAEDLLEQIDTDDCILEDPSSHYQIKPGGKEALQAALDAWAREHLDVSPVWIETGEEVVSELASDRGGKALPNDHVALLWNWVQGDDLIVPYSSLDTVFSARVLTFLESIDPGSLGNVEDRWCRLSRSRRIELMSGDSSRVLVDSESVDRMGRAWTLWSSREGKGSFGNLGEAEARVISLLVDKLSSQSVWPLLAQAAEDTWKRLSSSHKSAVLGATDEQL